MINRLINKCSSVFHRLKTWVFYKPQFRSIGSGTTLRKPLMLVNPKFITLGKRVLIREGARLEVLTPHDGSVPALVVGDNTNIEQNVHIICGRRIVIGSDVSITANCSIVDVSHPYENVGDGTKIGGSISIGVSGVEIGDGSFVGIGSVILPDVIIGRHVVVGANSVVNSNLPDYCVAAGAPARIIKKYDERKKRWERVD